MLPARAAAEAPFRVATQIEDRAGVLGDRQAEVRAAAQTLQDTEHVQLWVAYVDTFSGLGAQEWADRTARRSDLGLRDVLLAVAAGDRAYAYAVDPDFPLTQAQMGEVMTVAVEPALAENDWAGGGDRSRHRHGPGAARRGRHDAADPAGTGLRRCLPPADARRPAVGRGVRPSSGCWWSSSS